MLLFVVSRKIENNIGPLDRFHSPLKTACSPVPPEVYALSVYGMYRSRSSFRLLHFASNAALMFFKVECLDVIAISVATRASCDVSDGASSND